MEVSTISLIFLSILASIAIAYFQYYFKSKRVGNITHYLFVLRALVFFILFLLLINPTIEKTELENQKPALSVLIDNSESIPFFKEDSLVRSLVSNIKLNKSLNRKFDINYYSFGTEFRLSDNLDFKDTQTNIHQGLQMIGNLNKQRENPVILISDGNQTLGRDYEYLNLQKPIYPIVIGDTLTYEDVSIRQLNANRYSFLNNQFPIETILYYEGEKDINTQFVIENRGKIIFRKSLSFGPDKRTHTIQTNIKSDKEGVNFYSATIKEFLNEKNIANNKSEFSVEVINKQSQVLILSTIYHPDIGALKKSIERDPQRRVTVSLIENKIQIIDYQLVVLYQPNKRFNSIVRDIIKEDINYFLISGNQTDWNFINDSNLGIKKNYIEQFENHGATFNAGYLIFGQKDINFSSFPPLKDKFGATQIYIPHQTLLNQNINGFTSEESLLATAEENNRKKIFLLGEGIWKWRSKSYLNNNSFNDFDQFIGNLIQYASSKKVRKRLDIDIHPLYNANALVKVGAFYVDNNYDFDPRAFLVFALTNKQTKEKQSYPFSLADNSYQLEIESLPSGEYSYTVEVEKQNISKSGNFRVNKFSVEEQFTNANLNKLKGLADRTGGKLYLVNQQKLLLQDLIENSQYHTVQKSVIKRESIINWIWVLFLIAGLLAIEWFARKYYGKI